MHKSEEGKISKLSKEPSLETRLQILCDSEGFLVHPPSHDSFPGSSKPFVWMLKLILSDSWGIRSQKSSPGDEGFLHKFKLT